MAVAFNTNTNPAPTLNSETIALQLAIPALGSL